MDCGENGYRSPASYFPVDAAPTYYHPAHLPGAASLAYGHGAIGGGYGAPFAAGAPAQYPFPISNREERRGQPNFGLSRAGLASYVSSPALCSFYGRLASPPHLTHHCQQHGERGDEEDRDEGATALPPPRPTPELLSPAPPLFRPIDFESASGNPAHTYGGAKSTQVQAAALAPQQMLQTTSQGEDGASPPDSLLTASPGAPPPQVSRVRGVSAYLSNDNVWATFANVGNEMIVTKHGRRLFPTVQLNIRGLADKKRYSFYLKVVPSDNYRYKYLNHEWKVMGDSEVNQNRARMSMVHSCSPRVGTFWTTKPVSFKSMKITHVEKSQHGDVLVHTMHKYHLELVIKEVHSENQVVLPLPHTTFIAVTAYQNSLLTDLKIENNPFAKGFRDKRSLVDFSDSLSLPILPLTPPSSTFGEHRPLEYPMLRSSPHMPFSNPYCYPPPFGHTYHTSPPYIYPSPWPLPYSPPYLPPSDTAAHSSPTDVNHNNHPSPH